MKNTKHTPGPWNKFETIVIPWGTETAMVQTIENDEGAIIAQVTIEAPFIDDISDLDEGFKNARLISAAPELLEALERLLAQSELLAMASDLNYSCYGFEFELAKSAIKKAKGEF